MKKLVLTVALVALLAAAVFGGQALASSKPADVSVSEPMSEEILSGWGSSYWGYPVRMKTLSGNLTLLNDTAIIEENYSGVRHVSLTLYVEGIDSEDDGQLQVFFTDNFSRALDNLDGQTFLSAYEFDAVGWRILLYNIAGDPIRIWYDATITYPSNQW